MIWLRGPENQLKALYICLVPQVEGGYSHARNIHKHGEVYGQTTSRSLALTHRIY